MQTTNITKVHKLFPEAHIPVYGSEWAACFDLSASIRNGDEISIRNDSNRKSVRIVCDNMFTLYSEERCLVPTGLIFHLSQIESLRIHPRSGLAWKDGISVANCEGIVDADYVDETFVMLHNLSTKPFLIADGMRIAQAEIVECRPQTLFLLTPDAPVSKTSRDGGFGSTGV